MTSKGGVRRDVIDPDKVYHLPSRPKDSYDDDNEGVKRKVYVGKGPLTALEPNDPIPAYLPHWARLVIDEAPYPSVEHALLASRSSDSAVREAICRSEDILLAKRHARAAPMTEEWKTRSPLIMESLMRDRICNQRALRQKLIDTGKATLVWKNSYGDRTWGESGGTGKNLLGGVLEKLREEANSGKDSALWISDRLGPLSCPSDTQIVFEIGKPGAEDEKAQTQLVTVEKKSIVRIGKLESRNDIVLGHPTVSREHAMVAVTKMGEIWLVCLGASNGTMVDESRLDPFSPKLIYWPTEKGHSHLSMAFGLSLRRVKVVKLDLNFEETQKGALLSTVIQIVGKATTKARTVFVGNLPFTATEEELRDFFSPCGPLFSIRIPPKEGGEGGGGVCRGFAFVQFEKDIGVTRALGMTGNMFKDRSIRIKRSGDDSRPPPDPKRRQQYVVGDRDQSGGGGLSHYEPEPNKRPRGPD